MTVLAYVYFYVVRDPCKDRCINKLIIFKYEKYNFVAYFITYM